MSWGWDEWKAHKPPPGRATVRLWGCWDCLATYASEQWADLHAFRKGHRIGHVDDFPDTDEVRARLASFPAGYPIRRAMVELLQAVLAEHEEEGANNVRP